MLAALVLSTTSGCFNGCNKKRPEEGIEPPPPAPALAPAPAAPAALTADALIDRFETCLGLWNENDDAFATCWTPGVDLRAIEAGFPDMRGEAQLELVHGHDLAVVTWLGGTHTGPLDLPGAPKTMNQPVGLLMGQVMELDDQGAVKHDRDYVDVATVVGQLAPNSKHPVRPVQTAAATPKQVVIAKNDDAEKANLAVAQQLVDATNKHDATATAALFAPGAVWSEQQNPKDWTTDEMVADLQQAWTAFSDLKTNTTATWAAGDYVVVVATLDGTNDGVSPQLGIATPSHKPVSVPFLRIHKLAAGKIAATWVFAQGVVIGQ